jgi:hypothetical protein
VRLLLNILTVRTSDYLTFHIWTHHCMPDFLSTVHHLLHLRHMCTLSPMTLIHSGCMHTVSRDSDTFWTCHTPCHAISHIFDPFRMCACHLPHLRHVLDALWMCAHHLLSLRCTLVTCTPSPTSQKLAHSLQNFRPVLNIHNAYHLSDVLRYSQMHAHCL